ncbi:MAG: oxaloacetate decarboxylase subunit alpha, partial [Firmicutes bacterium]|nr:oxaloacetate decarboxylase subunit alpha [Bacillota bacterium]
GLDGQVLLEIADYFKKVRADFLEDGTLNPISMTTDTQCLTYQMPGGMISNLLSQLKGLGAEDKFQEALKETPLVRKDMGYPPLVTPTSQIVGSQAVLNVMAGERYKTVSKEVKAYCRGEYGKTPAPIDEEVRAKVLGGEPPVVAPLDEEAFAKAEAYLGSKARCEEDVLSYIAFPAVAEKFFEEREAKEQNMCSYSIERIDE